MKCVIIVFAALLIVARGAGPAPAQEDLLVAGEQTWGVRGLDLSEDSAKFFEYRDLRRGLFLGDLRFSILDPRSGLFLGLSGSHLLFEDQTLRAQVGSFAGRWRLTLNHSRIPHRYSYDAQTPFISRGDGLFTVAGKVGIADDGNDATGTPSLVPTVPQMLINDALIARYLETNLHPTRLATRRQRTTAALDVSRVGPLGLRLAYGEERRDGNRLTYGPIGDRPPRTLNAQLFEPVDYTTREIHALAGFGGRTVQSDLRYTLSLFENNLRSLRWENMFFTPNPGADYTRTVPDTPRHVADFAQRQLPPDNHAHNLSLTTGIDLPLASRLASTIAVGYWRQDESLLPFSYSTLGGDLDPTWGDSLDWNDPGKLPRRKADAKMSTLRLDLDYTVNPVARLNLRPFFRYYDLDNDTPTEEWRYVTQDVAGTNGSVNYRNFRRNLAYDFDRQRYGIDARYGLDLWRTSLGLGYAREHIGRDFREADTDEDVLTASVRTRPSRALSLSARYLRGDREGDGYDYRVTGQTYWYTFEQGAADVDNPRFLFADHPDLRRFDVSDRRRNQLSLIGTLVARQDLDLSVSYRLRDDDFDSSVRPVAPLLGTDVPLPNPEDEFATTPGRQLGILEDRRQSLAVDLNYMPTERWTFTVFAEREDGRTDARGMVFNENQRREPSNPGVQPPTALGPWTDPDRLYETESKELTNTLGLRVGYALIPDRLRLTTDYSLSRGKFDLEYSGYGSDAGFLGRDWETFAFGFDDPETIRHHRYELNASLEYLVSRNLSFGLHYLFSWYRIEDWMQEPSGPWVETVGSEHYWRDTSRDNRWGNRLVSMGSYLAPTYEAHLGSVTMTMRF